MTQSQFSAAQVSGAPITVAPLELAVVLPTLNERGNIAPMVARLEAALGPSGWEAVFVDDNSHDGTADEARRIGQTDSRIRVIQRIGRRGLASAAIEGMCATAAPYVAVMVDETVQVPREYVQDGEIVLNVSFDATSSLQLGNEFIEFKARFGGKPRDIMVPINRVMAIYARENGQGMAFEVSRDAESAARKKPELKEADASNQRPETAPGLSAVPASDAPVTNGATPSGDEPDPPKKNGPPRLTRIK